MIDDISIYKELEKNRMNTFCNDRLFIVISCTLNLIKFLLKKLIIELDPR